MGRLIKNHWARLIVLTAAIYHLASTIQCFFWPKFFFDFYTKNFDAAFKPIPIFQIINLLIAFTTLAYEWPLKYVAGTKLHGSVEARMVWLPFCALAAVMIYQATNPAVYYCVATGVYFWGFCEGEVICAVPWTLPKRVERRGRVEKV
ncbi:hypothetical protein LTR62_007099 [Meristemomyces frigidus]|uniref:DUF7727 domain-containing protein n=1 Tax=Meristemomyces frigidus TaxID=1508187 RepID=A0AAN7TCM4_9PEZI|nr:hypothetical protein LTR62_007099 [Meristemomyces frigidus]